MAATGCDAAGKILKLAVMYIRIAHVYRNDSFCAARFARPHAVFGRALGSQGAEVDSVRLFGGARSTFCMLTRLSV